ncbi:MAG: glycoside hydrolase family 3 N-terminal domain-containing protein, partial [Verrucomicrobiota bacterium]
MTKIKNIVMLALVSGHAMAAELPPYQNPQTPLEQRVEDLLGRLTLEEKIGLLHGSFEVGGIQRLNIPPLSQSDGPVGVRNPTATTALPCTLSLSCTWDVNAAQAYGRLLGEEMLALHKNVLFGPGIDLMRDPCGGRNFEYMGEDPLLTGSLSVSYILGVQTNGVAACAKHLVANDCEHRRFFTSSNMGDRTLREMSLLPFEMA